MVYWSRKRNTYKHNGFKIWAYGYCCIFDFNISAVYLLRNNVCSYVKNIYRKYGIGRNEKNLILAGIIFAMFIAGTYMEAFLNPIALKKMYMLIFKIK